MSGIVWKDTRYQYIIKKKADNVISSYVMDNHDIVEFSHNGEEILGVVIKHYDHPLNDFYVIYADNCLYEYHSKDESLLLVEDAFLPIYDAALNEFKLKQQRLKDIKKAQEVISTLLDMENMDIGKLFD